MATSTSLYNNNVSTSANISQSKDKHAGDLHHSKLEHRFAFPNIQQFSVSSFLPLLPSTDQIKFNMKRNTAICVVFVVVIAFCVIFGWWLHRCMMRAVSIRVAYRLKQQDAEDGNHGPHASGALPPPGPPGGLI